MEKSERVVFIGIILNAVLFISKITIGLLSNSLSLMSDAFNSLLDILSYSGIYLAVKISNKKTDMDHQFGHSRAEPIAGLIVAVFAFVLGIEIIRSAISDFLNPREHSYEILAISVLLFTMAVKTFMFFWFTSHGKKENRPAIIATGIDSRNDVLVSGIALSGVIGPIIGISVLDGIAAIVISIFVFYSAYRIGIENIDFLMGKSPPIQSIEDLKKAALKIKGVTGINTVRSQYIGNKIYIEIHIEVDRNCTTQVSHGIGKRVQKALKKFDYVDQVFVHIDPK